MHPSKPAFELFPCDSAAAGPPSALAHDWVFSGALTLLSDRVDTAIGRILQQSAEDVGADRGWMLEYDDSGLVFRNTHEWCRRNVSSHVEDLQYIPVSMIAWLHGHLVAGQAVMINSVQDLPPVVRELRAELIRQQVKSTLNVPVFYEGRLRACIGFDSTLQLTHWGPEVAGALARTAQLIAQARYGQKPSEGLPLPAVQKPHKLTPMVYLRMHGQARGVTLLEVSGVRSAHDYTRVHLHNGDAFLDVRPLSVWQGLLPSEHFLRIHRSSLVNLVHVQQLDRHAGSNGQRWDLTLRGLEQTWSVSRPYRRELRHRLGV